MGVGELLDMFCGKCRCGGCDGVGIAEYWESGSEEGIEKEKRGNEELDHSGVDFKRKGKVKTEARALLET